MNKNTILQAQKRNAKQTSLRDIELRPKLSSCAQAYAKALVDPFGPTDEAPCIPDTLVLPSYKFSTTVRGVATAGTAGFGYVSFDPWLAVHNGATVAGAFTNAPVRFTQSAFAGAFFDPASIPAGTGVLASNSQITVAAMQSTTATRDYRLVGAGVRIRYTGTELNRGGRLVLYRNRSNQPSIGLNTIATALLDNYYSSEDVDRDWATVTYSPSRADDITYQKYIDPIVSSTVGYPIFMIMFESTAGNQFEFECIAHYEMIAGSVGIPVTPSHSDPIGMGAVVSSLPDRYKSAGLGLLKFVMSRAADYLVDQVSQVVPLQGRIVLGAAKALPWAGPRVEEVHEDL